MLEIAKVKFEYFREKLGGTSDHGSFQGEVIILEETNTHKPFRHGGMLVLPWSLM